MAQQATGACRKPHEMLYARTTHLAVEQPHIVVVHRCGRKVAPVLGVAPLEEARPLPGEDALVDLKGDSGVRGRGTVQQQHSHARTRANARLCTHTECALAHVPHARQHPPASLGAGQAAAGSLQRRQPLASAEWTTCTWSARPVGDARCRVAYCRGTQQRAPTAGAAPPPPPTHTRSRGPCTTRARVELLNATRRRLALTIHFMCDSRRRVGSRSMRTLRKREHRCVSAGALKPPWAANSLL